MYNYRTIHKRANNQQTVASNEASNMRNAWGPNNTRNVNQPVNNNNASSSVFPWVVLGGAALTGVGAWYKYGDKIKNFANTYNKFKEIAPKLGTNIQNMSGTVQQFNKDWRNASNNRPKWVPEGAYDMYWLWKNRHRASDVVDAVTNTTKQVGSAVEQLGK